MGRQRGAFLGCGIGPECRCPRDVGHMCMHMCRRSCVNGRLDSRELNELPSFPANPQPLPPAPAAPAQICVHASSTARPQPARAALRKRSSVASATRPRAACEPSAATAASAHAITAAKIGSRVPAQPKKSTQSVRGPHVHVSCAEPLRAKCSCAAWHLQPSGYAVGTQWGSRDGGWLAAVTCGLPCGHSSHAGVC